MHLNCQNKTASEAHGFSGHLSRTSPAQEGHPAVNYIRVTVSLLLIMNFTK